MATKNLPPRRAGGKRKRPKAKQASAKQRPSVNSSTWDPVRAGRLARRAVRDAAHLPRELRATALVLCCGVGHPSPNTASHCLTQLLALLRTNELPRRTDTVPAEDEGRVRWGSRAGRPAISKGIQTHGGHGACPSAWRRRHGGGRAYGGGRGDTPFTAPRSTCRYHLGLRPTANPYTLCTPLPFTARESSSPVGDDARAPVVRGVVEDALHPGVQVQR